MRPNFYPIDLSQIEQRAARSMSEGRIVLSTLRVLFEGGPMGGVIRDYPDRDIREVAFGTHSSIISILDYYDRTIDLSPTGRTIFRYRTHEWITIDRPSLLRRVAWYLGLSKPRTKIIPSPV